MNPKAASSNRNGGTSLSGSPSTTLTNMSTATPTLALNDTFELLAQAAQCRHPVPEKENRGLCPAHEDRRNPALVFTFNEDRTRLLVHCFARECSLDDVARAIGVHPASFFVRSGKPKGDIPARPRWRYLPFVELIKLLPLPRHFDDEVEAVFNVMETLGDLRWDAPMRDLPRTTIDACIWFYIESEFKEGDNWYEIRDQAYSLLRQWDLEQRTNLATEVTE